jgi:release factor glutamine methyltransferase
MENLIGRRLGGEPLPYILGYWEFYGLEFQVTSQVLIPRPETELLVEEALKWLRAHPGRRRAADVGAGSGCISITLAQRVPDLRITALDTSRDALSVARHNASRLAPDRLIFLVQSDLLSAVNGPYDLVCANLPYIPSEILAGLEVSQHEPVLALDGGEFGLDLITRLLQSAPLWLADGGLLLLEIESGQGKIVPEIASQYLPQSRIQLLHDLAGHPRLVSIEKPGLL